MGAQTYPTFVEPDYDVLKARNTRYLKALATAHPVEAHDIVRRVDRRAEVERVQRLSVIEAQIERLIERVNFVLEPTSHLRGDWSAPSFQAPSKLIMECCAKHNVSLAEITSNRRRKSIIHARQEAMYRLYDETNLSLPQIGQKLGGKDHSTVIHGCRAHAKRSGVPEIVPPLKVAS